MRAATFTSSLRRRECFFADAQTLVLVLRIDALAERDKQVLTTSPRTGSDAARPGVRALATQRLGNARLWWIAVEIERPGLVQGLLPLGGKNADMTKALEGVKSIAVGFELPPPWRVATLVGSIECPDAAAGRRLAEVLEAQTVAGLAHPKSSRRPRTARIILSHSNCAAVPKQLPACLEKVECWGCFSAKNNYTINRILGEQTVTIVQSGIGRDQEICCRLRRHFPQEEGRRQGAQTQKAGQGQKERLESVRKGVRHRCPSGPKGASHNGA